MMRKLEFSEQEVIEAYEKFENARQVSALLGCSEGTIYRILKKHDIPRTHRHPERKKENTVRVSNCNTKHCPGAIRLYITLLDLSNRQIAEVMGMPPQSVVSIRRNKLPDLYQQRRDYRNVDLDAIEREYLAGASTYELGEKYGVDHATIGKWMRKRGHCRGRGHGPSQIDSHDRAVARFIERYPEQIDKCKTWRKRYDARRRYRIVSRPHDGGITGLTWQDIYVRNGHDLTCWICKRKCVPYAADIDRRPSIDHVIPLSNGGTDTYDNTRIAHYGCNRVRSNKVQLTLDFMEYEQG